MVIGTEGGLLGRLGIADQLRSKTDRDSGDLARLDDHHLRITFCYTPNCILTDGREHSYTSAPLRLLANSWTASLTFLLSTSSPMSRMKALPTTTPSAAAAISLAWAGVEIPKPATTERSG